MENIKTKYDMFISLGYNCFPKKYIDEKIYKIGCPTNVFDRLGTPLWSISELIETKLEHFFDINDYDIIEINKGDRPIITNVKYYVRIFHDLTKIDNDFDFKIFKDKYNRRMDRFYDILNDCEKNGKKILFICSCEYMDNRILYDEIIDKYNISEIDYLKNIVGTFTKIWPLLNFKILYLSKINDNCIIESKIIIIKLLNEPCDWLNCVQVYSKTFHLNKIFISLNI